MFSQSVSFLLVIPRLAAADLSMGEYFTTRHETSVLKVIMEIDCHSQETLVRVYIISDWIATRNFEWICYTGSDSSYSPYCSHVMGVVYTICFAVLKST